MSAFGPDKLTQARKQHQCFLCGEPIVAGEQYYRRTGTWEGFFSSIVMHPECKDASDDWDEDVWATFLMGDMKRGGERR